MYIKIGTPFGYSCIGRKDNQEDSLYPLLGKATEKNRCFVLCDGVGGSEHGEVASRTVCDAVGEFFDRKLKENVELTASDAEAAVTMAYDALDLVDDGSDERKMATTLTCVCLHNNGVLAFHMGDSRIYHVRPGVGILYQSSDHSLVNALLQAGEITPEEVADFPRKNVITRALQPHADKRCKADIIQLTDVNAGDYLFLCCDGVMEQLTNELLVEILSGKDSDKAKIRQLEAVSTNRTKDNYTACLIPIVKVTGTPVTSDDDSIIADISSEAEPHFESVSNDSAAHRHGKFWIAAIVLLLLLTAAAALCYLFIFHKPDAAAEILDGITKICKSWF